MVALQTLYEWDFNEEKNAADLLQRNIENSGLKVEIPFCEKLVKGVSENIEAINAKIKETAPEWPLEQIAGIDRSILRIGIFELIFDKEVPPKAVINEAVELGKEFGGENSGKFVNGVLGTIYRASERYEDENLVTSAGGIIFRKDGPKTYFIVVKNAWNRWTFPKGEVNEGETWQEAAVREIQEETGINEAEILGEIGEIKFTDKSKEEPIKKSVHFYLIKTNQVEVTEKPAEEVHIKEVKWMERDDVLKSLDYENLIDLFKKAVEETEKI
jgi:N utilization substance protein B